MILQHRDFNSFPYTPLFRSVGGGKAALTGNPSTDYSTHTILLHLLDYGYGKYEMGYASAIAVILFVMMVGSWLVIHAVLNRFSSD